jgi:hypothetical protein
MDCSLASPAKVPLRKGAARRRLARKMLLPVFPHLQQLSSRLPTLPPLWW